MKSSTMDNAEGKLHEAKGKIKETIGKAIGNRDFEAEGKDEHLKRPSAEYGVSYITYHPAYRAGYEGYTPFPDKKYEDVGSQLR